MTAFEHVILLLSFVYAMALTHLLSSTAELIRAGSRVKFSWLHAGWMLNALMLILANWISFFDMRKTQAFSMGTILFVFFFAITNYLAAALVCMDVPAEGPVDMQDFHVSQARKYIGAVIVSFAAAIAANLFLGGAFNIDEYVQQNLAVVPMLVAAVVAIIWIRGRIQATALIVLGALWVFLFADLQSALR